MTPLPLLISADALANKLAQENQPLQIISSCKPQVHKQASIEGAIFLHGSELMHTVGDATGLLPDTNTLIALLAARGISKHKPTVVYDDEGGGWAARVLWTLEILGFEQLALLDGGLHAWMASGEPLVAGNMTHTAIAPENTASESIAPENIASESLAVNLQPRITKDELITELHNSQTVLWDCRSLAEYTGEQLTAKRGGHIPGAKHYEWTTPMNREKKLILRPLDDIRAELASLGITADKPIITYCQSHHRSSFTYWLGKVLGFNIRAYDGAWSEWGNQNDTPVETGRES